MPYMDRLGRFLKRAPWDIVFIIPPPAGVCWPSAADGGSLLWPFLPRPDNDTSGGVNLVAQSTPQDGCLNSTTAPPLSQCWLDRGIFQEVLTPAINLNDDISVSAGYLVVLLRTSYLCEQQMSYACVMTLGPLGCYLNL